MDLATTTFSQSMTGLKDNDRSLIRGAFSLTLCSFISQVINYGTHIGLGRFFTPGVYGYFGIVASTFSIMETILRWGLSRAVAFYVAQDRGGAKEVLKKSLELQTVYSLICFFLFFSFADRLAVILGDLGLSSYLRWASFFILTIAFVPVYSGFLNGMGDFNKQGAIAVIRSLVKLLLIVILLAAGMQIYGVIVAYTLSTLMATAYGIWASRPEPSAIKKQIRAKNIITFGFPLFVSALAVSLLMRIDLFMIQSLLEDRVLTGLYTSASTLIRAPYFLTLGAGLVLFQTVAQLKAKSPSEVRGFISKTIYYYILVLAPVPFILSAGAEEVLGIAFGNNYLLAAPAFKILSFCFAFMVLHDVLTSFIAALDRPRLSMALNLCLFPVQAFLIYEWTFTKGLVGVALATTTTWALGTLIGGLYLWHMGYLLLPKWNTVFHLGIACLCIYYLALWISPSGLWLLPFFPLVYFFYLAFLRLMGEFSNGEVHTLVATFLPAWSHSQRA